MKNLFRLSLVTITLLVISFAYAGKASAQGCVVTGGTPGGGEVVNCSGTDTVGFSATDNPDDVTIEANSNLSSSGNQVIDTQMGNDKVLMKGGVISGDTAGTDCIELGEGESEFHMLGGSLLCEHGVRVNNPGSAKITIEDGILDNSDECMNTFEGADEFYISGGVFNCGSSIIQSNQENDIVVITGGILTQTNDSDEGIETGDDNDMISISHATVDGSIARDRHAVDGGDDDDIIKLGTNARILGLSTGGNGFDTLVFEMEVPQEFIGETCARILSQSPQNGSTVINGLFYEWEDFEVILCELVPGDPGRIAPIPTLSQWAMITMAGVIGIVGVLFVVRRRVAA